MIRLYLKLSLPIMIIFLTVSLAARALGATQPPNPALRGFTEGCEDKPQPCWYGIIPGVTTAEEVNNLSAAWECETAGVFYSSSDERIWDTFICVSGKDNFPTELSIEYSTRDRQKLNSVAFRLKEIKLGELTIALGVPIQIAPILPESLVVFKNQFYVFLREGTGYFSWDNQLNYVSLSGLKQFMDDKSLPLFIWHGSIPKWRYCQLEPYFFNYCPN